MEIIPTSILISSDPLNAIRNNNNNNKLNQNQLNRNQNQLNLYSKSIPKSKRPKRKNQIKLSNSTTKNKNKTTTTEASSSTISTSSSSASETITTTTTIESSSPDNNIKFETYSTLENNNNNNNKTLKRKSNKQLDSLAPALPHLPPTPLTPHEILQSSTLSRLFKKSNTVFTQIADSATGLIQTDLAIGNKLNQLTELLRGDLNSRSSIQLIQQQLEKQQQQQQQESTDHNADINTSSSTFDNSSSNTQFQILTQTLHIIHSLFITPNPITIPIYKKNPSSTLSNLNTGQDVEVGSKVLDVENQTEIYNSSLIQINKFLADLKDYRARLIELRNGCLGIEKRRRAMWYLIKMTSVGFDELVESNSHSISSNLDQINTDHSISNSSKQNNPILATKSQQPQQMNTSTTTTNLSNKRIRKDRLDRRSDTSSDQKILSEDDSGVEFTPRKYTKGHTNHL